MIRITAIYTLVLWWWTISSIVPLQRTSSHASAQLPQNAGGSGSYFDESYPDEYRLDIRTKLRTENRDLRGALDGITGGVRSREYYQTQGYTLRVCRGIVERHECIDIKKDVSVFF